MRTYQPLTSISGTASPVLSRLTYLHPPPKIDPMEDPEDTSGVISVDDIDFEYLNTEVHWATFQGSRIADGLISYP